MGLCAADTRRGARAVCGLAGIARGLGGGAMSAAHGPHGTHMGHGKPCVLNAFIPRVLCVLRVLSKTPHGNSDCRSVQAGAGANNRCRRKTDGTHGPHGTRLRNQSLTTVRHRTRHRVTRDTAGPSCRVGVGGTRSRDISVTKVKLERVACRISVQFKDCVACR